ncbi:MAG: ABC transporter permease [Nitriliruptor sp.]|uniref:ABC transporter permease n=1 Tax=Nitriliruptor sp. TaxID=2448056 RepID=UPI00349FE507
MAFFTDYLADPFTRDILVELSLEHVFLTLIPIAIAIVIGLTLGVIAVRFSYTRQVILNTTSTFLTFPSLALFSLFIPLVGIGYKPAIIPLSMYALLPIVRNTVTGLGGVDAAIVESARGMGMGAGRRLMRIELPTSWPVILTGIRVSTQLVIGIAAIAALVGGPGLGNEILGGIRSIGSPGALERLLGGTLAIAALAMLFDLLYLGIGRLTIPRGLRD